MGRDVVVRINHPRNAQQNTQLKWVMHAIVSDRGMSYVCERWRGGDAVHVRACVRVSAARRLWKR
jgi:hypothetical protein